MPSVRQPAPARSSLHPVSFMLLMVLVGLNLRPALSSLAPLLPRVEASTGISNVGIGALTTLPVLCLGLFAPLAPWLSNRLGAERSLSAALLVLATGLALRGLATPFWLFAGTLLVGAGIGVVGSLLPAFVKRELPRAADLTTGVYTMALCLGGALGAGLSIPMAEALGSWSLALMSWSALAIAALIAWWRMMPQPSTPGTRPAITGNTRELMRQPLAWHVMLLMGAQSSLAYIVFGWLPSLLIERGYDAAQAGWMMAASVMVQLFAALAAPWIARLGRDQRPVLLLTLSMVAGGLSLLLVGPIEWRWAGVLLLGLGQGGGFSMALTLIVLRTADSRLAGKLSGLVQGGGYTLAALGPLAVGVMRDFELGLPIINLALLSIAVLAAGFAWLAGRQRRLELDDQGRLFTRVYR
ncbi:MFS transporter [Halomonas sp. 18H]|uniref:MFS transporter n=1 Tax=Halomonas almeriensis TaxID=308163 RepID=UPI002232BA08|nr:MULTISPECIES: MFS transporter [Halomonas]MCW4151766.1 MFS transporter [Halomonas sp. 18H]MDN3554012.1 MFS transporter [Halomonas almeriensis]